jgi:hypothetical protein
MAQKILNAFFQDVPYVKITLGLAGPFFLGPHLHIDMLHTFGHHLFQDGIIFN